MKSLIVSMLSGLFRKVFKVGKAPIAIDWTLVQTSTSDTTEDTDEFPVSQYLTMHYEPQLGRDVTIVVNWNDADGNAKTVELDCEYSITEITSVLNSGSSVRDYAKKYHGKGNIDYVCQQLITDGIMTANYTLSDNIRI